VLPVKHDRQMRGPSCGAHALASVVTYWLGPATLTGETLYRANPPVDATGYSMRELLTLARRQGLLASAVAIPAQEIVRELDAGRPVMVPVRLPSIYVQQRALPGGDIPLLGVARNAVIHRAGRISEAGGVAMVNQHLLVVGYEDDRFVVVEPVMGYRTISAQRFSRCRRAFEDASIVLSAPGGPAPRPTA